MNEMNIGLLILTYCDKCDKLITNTKMDGMYSSYGLSINTEASAENKEYMREQLGPFEMNRRYSLCMECFLNNFGFVPRKDKCEL